MISFGGLHLHLTLVTILALAAQGRHGAATYDLPAYIAQLSQRSEQLSAAPTPQDAHVISDTMRDRWFVTVGDEIVIVDFSWIDAELTAAMNNPAQWPAMRANITRRLEAMKREASEPRAHSGENPGAALAGILSREEFQQSAQSTWLDAQRERVRQWILGLLNRLTGSGIGSRSVAIIFMWIASLMALSAFALWLMTTLTRRARVAALDLAAAAPQRAAAREWALRAMSALRAGDIRAAVRLGYHSALSRLDEQGTWRVDESRTPREYLRLLSKDDPRQSVISDLTRQFEQIWYGQRTATREDARRVAESLERLGCLHAADRAI